ncbi:LON peptidase substrate-binding domain-containing protein [soil metagenome]
MSGALPLRAPLFPLPAAILFPRAQLPLHIFEPRYREMVHDAVDGGGHIAIIQPLLVETAKGREPLLYSVGCVGEIVGIEELEDGRFNIVLNGSNRFRMISEVDLGTPYRNADLDLGAFDDREPPPLPMVHRAEVEREARRLGDALGLAVDWAAVSRLDDELLVNAIAQVAPFDVSAKQALLEAETLAGRADLLVQLMQFLRLSQSGGEFQPTLQ